jgi:hypothetical protein
MIPNIDELQSVSEIEKAQTIIDNTEVTTGIETNDYIFRLHWDVR